MHADPLFQILAFVSVCQARKSLFHRMFHTKISSKDQRLRHQNFIELPSRSSFHSHLATFCSVLAEHHGGLLQDAPTKPTNAFSLFKAKHLKQVMEAQSQSEAIARYKVTQNLSSGNLT